MIWIFMVLTFLSGFYLIVRRGARQQKCVLFLRRFLGFGILPEGCFWG